jgi:hypothetical protein
MMNCNLVGTIAAVNSATSVTLSTNVLSAVTNEQFAYASSDDAAIQMALNSPAHTIMFTGTYGITTDAGVRAVLTNRVLAGTGNARLLSIGPVAYDNHSRAAMIIDNGSHDVTLQNVDFVGTNALGELTSFGWSNDGLFLCLGYPVTGTPGNTFDFVLCGPAGGISRITVINCGFSHFWGIGFHAPGSVMDPIGGLTEIHLISSRATYNSYDGFNPNIYDGLVFDHVTGNHNGTGGLETASFGNVTITGSQFKYNHLGGAWVGGFSDFTSHGDGCQITGNEFSENGNGYLPNTVGQGLYVYQGPVNCTITGNTMRHNHIIGLQMDALPQDRNRLVTGNIIASNGINGNSTGSGGGFGIYGSFRNTTIANNLIIDEATVSIVIIERSANVVTVATGSGHSFNVGNSVQISGTGGIIDGTFIVTAVADGSHFSFAQSGPNISMFAQGTAYSADVGFTQVFGIHFDANGAFNTQILDNTIKFNHNFSVIFPFGGNFEPFLNVLFASNSNTIGGNDIDLYPGLVPSVGGLVLQLPDIQVTGTTCTTAAAPGATCTTTISNGSPIPNQSHVCSLNEGPVAQTGNPIILKTTGQDTFTVTIGTFDGQAAGGGTLTCWTNVKY